MTDNAEHIAKLIDLCRTAMGIAGARPTRSRRSGC